MDLIDWGKRFINACSANTDIEDLKKAADRGKQLVDAAKVSSAFMDKYAQANKTLEKASEGLGKVSKGLGKLDTSCKDIRAIMNIHAAIKVLNDDKVIYEDPEKAAKAFGQLFVGFGTLAKHLPPPANEYSAILLGCGDFFYNMLHKLVPNMRPNYRELEAQGAFDH
jgi:hypothetical protein